MKAERFPQWRLRRMNAAQREAYNLLRWHSPGPAERARLKQTLGWKRTREETIALAREVLAMGRMLSVAADECGVGARYLKRLLEQSETHQNGGRKRSIQAAKMAPSCDGRVSVSPGRSGRQMYAGDALTYDFEAALGGAG